LKPTVILLFMVPCLLMFPSSLVASQSVIAASLDYPPPSPAFTLLNPVMNEITYNVQMKNLGSGEASVNADLALPRTWAPDTYIQTTDIRTSEGVATSYENRLNKYLNLVSSLAPGDSVSIDVTYLELKYTLSVYTHNIVWNLSYPTDLAFYTQPETFIESDNGSIQSIASAIVGNTLNPFRIAEKLYSYTISHLTYAPQSRTQGALWALENGKGDCSEYSTLFAALMRAVGIPARTVAGHMSQVISLGGSSNSSMSWAGSPHMWAEFYVSGYGWVPVDPSSGENDPLNHFALSSTSYLPILKGQTMDIPYRSLFTVRSDHLEALDLEAVLTVRPLREITFADMSTRSVIEANDCIGKMHIAAASAYAHGFNVTSAHAIMHDAYSRFWSATALAETGDVEGCVGQATMAQELADTALDMISDIVIGEARHSITNAWHELRVLGALGAGRYLDNAERDRTNEAYEQMVIDASNAMTAADKSPNVLLFIALLAFSGYTVWAVANGHSRKL